MRREAAVGPPPVGACLQGMRVGGRRARSALPSVEPNHCHHHKVAMTLELILETVF